MDGCRGESIVFHILLLISTSDRLYGGKGRGEGTFLWYDPSVFRLGSEEGVPGTFRFRLGRCGFHTGDVLFDGIS